MTTYQMVDLADQNNRIYEYEYGTYSLEDGFKFNETIEPIIEDIGWRGFINQLFHNDIVWKLRREKVKRMSQADIERELGYRIQITDPQPDKKVVDEKHRKSVDDTVKFFKDFFGLTLDPEEYY